jgi:hypothetical protein
MKQKTKENTTGSPKERQHCWEDPEVKKRMIEGSKVEELKNIKRNHRRILGLNPYTEDL